MNVNKLFNISERISRISDECESQLKDIFKGFEYNSYVNQAKILKSFQDNKVATMHLGSSTGYGYGDVGREIIEKIYSDVFGSEDALVRVQFVNGTHAISTALFACLKPGDELLYITGKPYDTLAETIGTTENTMSLMSYGVRYNHIDLKDGIDFDEERIINHIKNNKVKMVAIQRSKGYAVRKSMRIYQIENIINKIKEIDNNIIIMVDNCYGELVEELEPTNVGADLCCGSLIKNLGGGLCETGAYIVGKTKYIELCAQRLTCPGIGKECGATLHQNRNILQGLFIAPSVVCNALKSMTFASCMFEKLGFNSYPSYSEKRTDIIQAIQFEKKEELVKFIQGIQKASPIDSHVTPYPWDMPGYTDQVIMAAGTFIEGASIELSADSPIRLPYVAYMQGGITYESAKLAILIAIENMLKED
ncbi:MAG: ynbB [Clostridia bacterium]|jgi:cystathionine beta-lyase family protein involved in aluminum resistance|nr:ynbB [Clostridia bacterium]